VNDSYGWPQLPQQNLCRVVGATGHLVVGGRAQPELLVIAASEHPGHQHAPSTISPGPA
jgi:hypothetical protein